MNSFLGHLLGGLAAVTAMVFTGCSPSDSGPQQIVIRGSNTVGEELAPRLAAVYTKKSPGTSFNMEFKGTSYGIGAIMLGKCDIATASRGLSTNEPALARERGVDLEEHLIGSYAVAVVVHPSNPLSDLSLAQVKDIFTGKVKNWKEVGGPDAAIQLCIRDQISGTHLGFQELAMGKQAYDSNAKTFVGYAEIAAAVAKDPAAIGYTGIDRAGSMEVKALSLDGASATVENVAAGTYPLARGLRLFTDKMKDRKAALAFVKFVESAEGQAVVAGLGFAPRAVVAGQ